MSSVFVSPVDLAAVNALSADSLIAHLGIEFTAAPSQLGSPAAGEMR